jgi:hypothetical protein
MQANYFRVLPPISQLFTGWAGISGSPEKPLLKRFRQLDKDSNIIAPYVYYLYFQAMNLG